MSDSDHAALTANPHVKHPVAAVLFFAAAFAVYAGTVGIYAWADPSRIVPLALGAVFGLNTVGYAWIIRDIMNGGAA